MTVLAAESTSCKVFSVTGGASPGATSGNFSLTSLWRCATSVASILTQPAAPSEKPICIADTRSREDPWTDLGLAGSSSRSEAIAARVEVRPSEVSSRKCLEPPSAMCRMNAPAKQSACCSKTIVGSAAEVIPEIFCMKWPYSWAITITAAIGPHALTISGSSTARSQPIELSSPQNVAFTKSRVLTPQNWIGSAERLSHDTILPMGRNCWADTDR